MALSTLRIILEMVTAIDALREVEAIMERLPRRHGHRFRALEREIEAVMESPCSLDLHYLGEGIFHAAPSRQIATILSTARELGV